MILMTYGEKLLLLLVERRSLNPGNNRRYKWRAEMVGDVDVVVVNVVAGAVANNDVG